MIYNIDQMNLQANYVGETEKKLRSRNNEHECTKNHHDENNQFGTHMLEKDCWFAFSDAKVITHGNTKDAELVGGNGHILADRFASSLLSIVD